MAPSRESKSNNFWALSNISEILFLELHRWPGPSNSCSKKMRTLGQKSRPTLSDN
jgi:alpha-mannosidase